MPTKAVGPRETEGKYDDYLVFNVAMDWLEKRNSRATLSLRQVDEGRSCTLPCKQFLRVFFDGSFMRHGEAQCDHYRDQPSAEPRAP